MKKKTVMTGMVVAGVLMLAAVNGHFLSRAMLSHGTGFMYYTISRTIVRQIPPEKRDIATELEYINRYIYRNVHPYGKVKDDGASWMLIDGEAWCDSVANIFIRLISPLDVRGYLAFLQMPSVPSPHTVAYCTPGVLAVKDVDYLQKNAAVADPQNGIIYRTKNGQFASPWQIANGMADIPQRLSGHPKLYNENPVIAGCNRPISTQPAFKRWFYARIFPLIPEGWAKNYIRLAVVLDNRIGKAKRMYYLSRIEQLFMNYTAAEEGYARVIALYPETRRAELASYWMGKIRTQEYRFP